jgi:hypothetical protein
VKGNELTLLADAESRQSEASRRNTGDHGVARRPYVTPVLHQPALRVSLFPEEAEIGVFELLEEFIIFPRQRRQRGSACWRLPFGTLQEGQNSPSGEGYANTQAKESLQQISAPGLGSWHSSDLVVTYIKRSSAGRGLLRKPFGARQLAVAIDFAPLLAALQARGTEHRCAGSKLACEKVAARYGIPGRFLIESPVTSARGNAGRHEPS